MAETAHILTFAPDKAVRRERIRSLLHFPVMNNSTQIQTLEKFIEQVIDSAAGVFLIELKLLPGNNIKVFVDGDSGVAIDKLVQYNRSLYKKIEEAGLFPGGDFALEVSSPGLDEPLKIHRQYLKNIGRAVEVITKTGVKLEGRLISASENEIVVEEEKALLTGSSRRGKGNLPRRQAGKKETVLHTVPVPEIKSTKIQIKF